MGRNDTIINSKKYTNILRWSMAEDLPAEAKDYGRRTVRELGVADYTCTPVLTCSPTPTGKNTAHILIYGMLVLISTYLKD